MNKARYIRRQIGKAAAAVREYQRARTAAGVGCRCDDECSGADTCRCECHKVEGTKLPEMTAWEAVNSVRVREITAAGMDNRTSEALTGQQDNPQSVPGNASAPSTSSPGGGSALRSPPQSRPE